MTTMVFSAAFAFDHPFHTAIGELSNGSEVREIAFNQDKKEARERLMLEQECVVFFVLLSSPLLRCDPNHCCDRDH